MTSIDPIERMTYIGGAEAFELLNQEQYSRGCVRALAYRKTGTTPDFPDEEPDAMLLEGGVILEPVVGTLYEKATGRKLRRTSDIVRRHPDYDWAGVHTDRTILTIPGVTDGPGDLEIKTRGEGPWMRIQRLGPFPGDVLQVHWSMFVTGHMWGALAILGLFPGLPLKHFDIKGDPEIRNLFITEGEKFADLVWGKGQLPDPPFPATDPRCKTCQFRLPCRGEEIDKVEAATLRKMRDSKKELVQINSPELTHTLADMDLMKAEVKSLKAAIDVAEEKAMTLMGTVDAALIHGYGTAYQMVWHGTQIDTDRFKAEHPDLYKELLVEKTGAKYIRSYPAEKAKK